MPPDTGPEGGITSLTCSALCTKKLPPLRNGAPWLHSSTLDQPVGSAIGEKQRTPSEPCDDAHTDDAHTDDAHPDEAPKLHRIDSSCDSLAPAIVTTVPPAVGPEKGKMPLTTRETTSNRTPLDVYSCPFVLTSTGTYPAAAAVVLHTTDDSLTYDASTDVALKRQRSAPSASAASEKPLPTTVTGVPPSDAPRTGHTDETAAAGRYVNATPLDENC